MQLADNLDSLEQEQAQMWELFAELMNLDPALKFTAKDVYKNQPHELNYSKSELNRLLFRLYVNKALIMHQKTANGTLYSLNAEFLTGEQQ